MKFNLKNRPIHKGYAGTTREFIVDQEKWFDGFEKELRDKLVYAEKTRKAWRSKSQHRIDEEIAREWDGIIIAIEEIFGE